MSGMHHNKTERDTPTRMSLRQRVYGGCPIDQPRSVSLGVLWTVWVLWVYWTRSTKSQQHRYVDTVLLITCLVCICTTPADNEDDAWWLWYFCRRFYHSRNCFCLSAVRHLVQRPTDGICDQCRLPTDHIHRRIKYSLLFKNNAAINYTFGELSF